MMVELVKTVIRLLFSWSRKIVNMVIEDSMNLMVTDRVETQRTQNIIGKSHESPYNSSLIVDTYEYDYVVSKLRSFFKQRGFLEAHPQNRLSILAACNDPLNVAIFNYDGYVWPLPQTGQMWLEYELLKNPNESGYFCQSTSYRHEPHPIPGRDDLIFPLFEFEMHGGMEHLITMEKELLKHLGYSQDKFIRGKYLDVAKHYGTGELEHVHEQALNDEFSNSYFLTDFPESTSPFWNMRRDPETKLTNKVDVILSGQETISSAEREVDIPVMLRRFNTLSDGGYKDKLYDLFGSERTNQELDDYLNFSFFKRSGGGIGVTRLIRSMRMEGLIPPRDWVDTVKTTTGVL